MSSNQEQDKTTNKSCIFSIPIQSLPVSNPHQFVHLRHCLCHPCLLHQKCHRNHYQCHLLAKYLNCGTGNLFFGQRWFLMSLDFFIAEFLNQSRIKKEFSLSRHMFPTIMGIYFLLDEIKGDIILMNEYFCRGHSESLKFRLKVFSKANVTTIFHSEIAQWFFFL